jgi:hypothetical protein
MVLLYFLEPAFFFLRNGAAPASASIDAYGPSLNQLSQDFCFIALCVLYFFYHASFVHLPLALSLLKILLDSL